MSEKDIGLHLKLTALEMSIHSSTYAKSLYVFADAIKEVIKDIEHASEDMGSEELPFVIDEGTELIETLLGASFLVIQTHITLVLENAKALCKNNSEKYGACKERLRKKGVPYDSNFSKIEILWALANYVKHNEEWSKYNWEKPEGFSKHTVPVIKAAGLHYGSTGNLREASKALGNESFCDASIFIKIVDDWAKEIYEEASSKST